MAKVNLNDEKICSICGDVYYGWGNNARPVNDGRCCDMCNYKEVIPARLREIGRRHREESKQ